MIGFWILSIACGIGGLVLGIVMLFLRQHHHRRELIGEPDLGRKPIVMCMLLTASGPIGFFFYSMGFAAFDDIALWILTGVTVLFAFFLYRFSARRFDSDF